MAIFLGIVSQKGGVGKSTLARLVAREYAEAGWDVKIADLDVAQDTSFHWQARRLQRALEPVIPVERFGTVKQALKLDPHYDWCSSMVPRTRPQGPSKLPKQAGSRFFLRVSRWMI